MEAETLEIDELPYSQLTLLSSGNATLSAPEQLDNVDSVIRSIMETLGPAGPGLLAITGVPNASKLRKELLPLARKLALLDPETRKRILKEHKLGSDVPLKDPNRSVSSFALQLKYVKPPESTESKPISGGTDHQVEINHQDVDQIMRESHCKEFQNLGRTFKELGFCMMELGLRLAQICDKAIGGCELEQSLLESSAAKGRLIHYHSALDGLLLKEMERSRGFGKKRQANIKKNQVNLIRDEQKSLADSELNSSSHDANSCGIHSNLWQQWHYDYGIFTILTAPFFILPFYSMTTKIEDQFLASWDEECPSPIGHTSLQIYDPNKNSVLMVKVPPESFIIQVGESADIISKGKLRSNLHSVYRPAKFENLSRETFVVFLQPAWSKTFSISDYPQTKLMLNGKNLVAAEKEPHSGQDKNKLSQPESGQDKNKLNLEIQRIVPPLASRLKDGMTFAEFSRETTKQYYGGGGLQSNR